MTRIHRRGAIAGSASGGPPPFVVTPIPTQHGTVGTAYSYTLTASGGTTPYSWSELNLPAGLTLAASTGVISGDPTTVETTEVSITCTDHVGDTAPASFSFQVTATTPAAPVLDSVVQNGPGTAFLTYSAAANAVAYGVNRNGVNLGSGNPNLTWEDPGPLTVGQTYTYTVYGVSSTGVDGPNSNAIPVTIVSEGLTLTGIANQSGTVGTGYSYTPSATGGVTPYAWTASGLPAGITINASSGVFSGTPTTVQDPEVTVTVTDAASDNAHTTFGFNVVASGAPTPVYPPPGGVGANVFNSDFTTMANASQSAGPYFAPLANGANTSNNASAEWANTNIVSGQLVLTLSSGGNNAYGAGAFVTTAPSSLGTGWPAPSIPFSHGGGGYFEASIVVPSGNWWAVWMTNSTNNSPYEEYDIAENGNSGADLTTGWHGVNLNGTVTGAHSYPNQPTVGSTAIIGGLWESGALTTYCNGVQQEHFVNGQGGVTINTNPMCIVLNIGSFEGPIPAYLKVNWVRFWAAP